LSVNGNLTSILSDHLNDPSVEDGVEQVAIQTSSEPGRLHLADMLEEGIQTESDLVHLSFRLLDPTVPGHVDISHVLVSDPSGRINELMGVRTDLRALPMDYALTQNYPNPFNPHTVVPYQLPESGQVSLVVYNTLGQRLRILVNEKQEAGYYKMVWDGKDEIGRQVASGVYLVRMEAGKFRQVRKMVLLK
jgi:hypothetical protein